MIAGDSAADNEVTAALDGLSRSVEANAQDQRILLRRIRSLRAAHAAGRPWSALLTKQTPPEVLALAGRMLDRLGTSNGRLRRALAGALREEGVRAPAIAQTFGVSRQRIAKLLSRPTA